ncbi:MAG: O-acetyl-ADP-ribose deacetylase [Methylobacterium sp.]|nr:O-acetyl-ADP-ribose deacetylase [Methylobacterium sp.]
MPLRTLEADITTLKVDAVVNAANNALLGGGGVDGAIHRAAGPQLLAECRMLGGCPTGEARITAGYRLRARHVIHTVGPVWLGGLQGEPQKLEQCYRSCLQLTLAHRIDSIAFPCISTGVYRYPPQAAAEIAVAAARDFIARHASPQDIIFCCYSAQDRAIYESLLHAT